MNGALIASPSAVLRIGLVQQLRRHRPKLAPVEAANIVDAMRILGDSRIDLAIVDDALLAATDSERLHRMLPGRVLVIATRGPPTQLLTGGAPAIDGTIDGMVNLGAIARALPQVLDALAHRQTKAEEGHASAEERQARPGSRQTGGATGATSALRRATASGRLAMSARVRQERPEIVLVAASTGGPSALASLLHELGGLRLPMIVAQHMPADQTASFARHLAAETGLEVIERGCGDVPAEAQVAVLRGGSDYRIRRRIAGRFRLLAAEVDGNVFHPSADLLFASAAEVGLAAIAVVLSGMGEDGARGAAAIAACGGRVLVQDFASCVVAGMPSAAHAACPAAEVATLPMMARHLSRWTAPSSRSSVAIREG
jgi:chemotaxis response regulator CheB